MNTKEFFESTSLFLYNKLLNSFPDFEAENFSEFILEGESNSNLINHYFHSIYPIVKTSPSIEHISTRLNLMNLLNGLNHDSLVLLWKTKLFKIFEWYENTKVVNSYFELLEQDKISNLIIYLYNLEINKKNYPIYYENALRLASGLLIYLKPETITVLSEHEYFKEIYENYDKIFSEKEIEILFKINPELVNLFQSAQTESDNFRYLATLHISDKADIESIITILQVEYDSCLELLAQGYKNTQGNFFIKDSKIGIKYEYLIEMIELFPENSRIDFLNSFFKIEKFCFLLSETQKESLKILVKENFKTLNLFRNKKLF